MTAQSSLNPKARVLAVIVMLAVVALAPARLTSWMGFVRDPLMAVLTPISGPASAVSRALRPGGASSEELLDAEALRGERDEYKRLYLSGQQRIDDLEALVRELQSGVEAMRAQRVRLLEGTRVGADLQNGTIEIARGSSHGVRAGALVTARRSQQIVGIVTDAGHLTSTVRLLTDARFQPKLMRGVVMPEEPVTPELMATLPVVQLRPAGDGTLITDLPIASATAEALKEGQEIRLRDDAWPSAAQMLVLGRVERVEQTRDRDVLWRHVRVRPALDNDLARVGSVMLLIPADDLPAPAGATGGRP